jgi:LacI family gluconate utilization system Gnt-I transcriptional repressor
VAARVGVSINTVSRSLRAPHTVRPDLRDRIAAALDEVNYVPNRLAGSLAGAHSGVVGVIITSLFMEFATIIEQLQRDLSSAGLSVMIGSSAYDPEEELRLVRAMLSWRPAAIALVGCDHHPRSVELLRDAQSPVVEFWDASGPAIDSMVGMDHYAIGHVQAAHLIAQGRKNIAVVCCIRPHDYRAHKRLEGSRRAVRESSGMDPIVQSAPSGGSPELGEQLVAELLERAPNVDGIVCTGDLLAFGVLKGLRERGRRVPDDVAVVSFGNNAASPCIEPALSTIGPPRVQIGHRISDIILGRIAGQPSRVEVLQPELITRESSAPTRRKRRR